MGGRTRISALLAATVAWVVGPAGCTSNTWRGEPRTFAGDGGGSAEAVFSTPRVVQRLASAEPGPELGRRDEALSVRTPEALTAIDDWPREPEPTLRRPRRIFLGTNTRQFIFFTPPRPHHRAPTHRHPY